MQVIDGTKLKQVPPSGKVRGSMRGKLLKTTMYGGTKRPLSRLDAAGMVVITDWAWSFAAAADAHVRWGREMAAKIGELPTVQVGGDTSPVFG